MTCSFCLEEGSHFVAIIQGSEPKQICKKCIKLGHAVPKAKPKPHTTPCFQYPEK